MTSSIILTVLQQTALTNSLASSSFLSFSYNIDKEQKKKKLNIIMINISKRKVSTRITYQVVFNVK